MKKNEAAVRFNLKGQLFVAVEDWRRSQPKIPMRAEAIRLLLWRGVGRSPEIPEVAAKRLRSRVQA